jgi:hypothetical protein
MINEAAITATTVATGTTGPTFFLSPNRMPWGKSTSHLSLQQQQPHNHQLFVSVVSHTHLNQAKPWVRVLLAISSFST